MGKIRDWWPSEDFLERRKSVAYAATSQTSSQSPAFGSAALRLSEVAAALNALPSQSSATSNDVAPPAPPPTLSRPVVKLANSQDHKDELLRKLLQRSGSSTDLASKPPPSPRSPSSSRSSKSANARSERQRKSGGGIHELQEKPIQKESLTRREIHIYSERQRRKGMTHLYATLHSLLPEAKPKTDRCTVLTEAMDYIQTLRRKLEDLGRQKSEILCTFGDHFNSDPGSSADGETASALNRLPVELSDEARAQLLSAADVLVRFCGRDAFITLNSPKKKGVWSGILQIFHEQDMELLNVTLSTSIDMDYHCIHAKIPVTSELRSQELQKMIQDLVLSHAVFE